MNRETVQIDVLYRISNKDAFLCLKCLTLLSGPLIRQLAHNKELSNCPSCKSPTTLSILTLPLIAENILLPDYIPRNEQLPELINAISNKPFLKPKRKFRLIWLWYTFCFILGIIIGNLLRVYYL